MSWRLIMLAACLSVTGCSERKHTPAPRATRPRVPPPLENPAGFCRDSCPLKVNCRLGRVAKALYQQELGRCLEHCLRWIKDHPQEAADLAPCYEHEGCAQQRACLAEVQRIVEDRKIPAKLKECQEMCVTLGTCQGDATDCRLRCKTGEVAVYRALIRCGTKRCPDLRSCVEGELSTKAGSHR